jgi:hypothetical protein
MFLLQPKLPPGATVTSAASWDQKGQRTAVNYRNQEYKVAARPNGRGECFDFTPPIPLVDEKPKISPTPDASADRLATLLTDYWYLPVVVAGVILLIFKTPSRRDPDPHKASIADVPLLVTNLPDFAEEIQTLLEAAGENALAAQVPRLKIVDRCRCGDDFCSTFYVGSKPEGSYGTGHRNVSLEPKTGMLIVDVVDEKIAAVEVLYRDDFRKKLHELLP